MSGLRSLLHVGASGLHAHGFGLSVASQNAQNASTPGYSRRDVRLWPGTPPPPGGGGVIVRGSRRIVDDFVERRLLGAGATRAEAHARSNALEVLDRVFAEGPGGLGASLDDFEVALTELSQRPGEPATRSAVLAAADRLGVAFSRAASDLSGARRELDERIHAEVESVNQKVGLVADLGAAIRRAEADGTEASDLRDRRDQALSELAEQLPIVTVQGSEGELSVRLGGLALVSPEGRASRLEARPDPVTGRTVVTRRTAGLDQDVTEHLTSGELGGLLAARDGAVLEAVTALDQLAFDLAGAYNTVHELGVGLDGLAGRHLFASSPGPEGAAARFSVSDELRGRPDRLAAGLDPALGAGDNRNALALAGLADAPIGSLGRAQQALSSMIGAAGQAVAGARLDADFSTAAFDQASGLRERVSGVSLDEEMVALSRFQRGYQAALRVVQVADRMLEELVNLGR